MQLTDALRERGGFNPQDYRECPLGRLAAVGIITREEYQAGVTWRKVYLGFLISIGAPQPYGASDEIDLADDDCEHYAKAHKHGCAILDKLGKRVLHAVNAVAVFEESEELGDFEFTARAAKRGLAALARGF